MRYQGSEAYDWEAAAGRRERLEAGQRPSFEVVSGGGLDARARRGVSPAFVARVKAVIVAVAVLVALNVARVALTVSTVSTLQSCSELKSQIATAQTLNSDLRIERSVLSSNSRITRIATQNYGMVTATEFVSLDLSEPEAAQGAADGAASADGDAAQPAAEAGEAAPLG